MPTGIFKRTKKHNRAIREAHKRKNFGFQKGNKLGKGCPKGIKRSEEFKKKISQYRIGRHSSEKTKKKLSRMKKGKPLLSLRGEKNHFWKDGRSKNPKWRSWIKNKRNRLKRVSKGSHTFGEWELLKKQYGYCCPFCGKCEPEINLTEDHIIPLSKGGSDYIENIQPLCKSCNSKKHNKIITKL